MSDENAKNGENDLSILNVSDQQNTTPQQSSPASSASSLERRSNSTEGGQLVGSGIIEVSDDNKDPDEVEEEIGQLRRSHMPLRRAHAHIFLMQCGHPAPPVDRNQIKKWAAHGRSWCQTCNPLTTRNLVRGSKMLSGWRKTMEQLVDKSIFPMSVLNLNETFVYTGNNGHDTSMQPVISNGPPFMLDLDIFVGIVCANDLCRLPLRALSCLRLFVHSDSRVIPFFEKIHPQSLCHFSVNLLETAIRLMEEPQEQSEIAFKRSKTALQCFYQTCVRVPFFRETICKHQLSQWLNLLRIEFLRTDIVLSILMVIREMHAWFFHSDDLYVRLLSDMLLLYSSHSGLADHRTLITNIFTTLFHTDPSFLHGCFQLMDRDTFTELLSVLESALNFAPIYRLREFDMNIPPKACLHPLNLAFCLELFELIDRELSECRVQKFDIGARLAMLVHIINFCASSRDVYNDILQKGSAISLICGLLKALMFAQREVNTFLLRAQHLINNNAQRMGSNSANAKFRYEAQQRGALKARPIRDRIQTIQPHNERNNQPKRAIKTADYDSNGKMKNEEHKAVQVMHVTSSDQLHELGSRTQHAFDNDKHEWKLEKEEELPVDIKDEHAAENGDEPRKKHARLHSGSENSDSPVDGNPTDEQHESIQVDDNSAEEMKPLLSPSDVSCSTSDDEAPQLPAQRQPRLPMAKVVPSLNNPANISINSKTNANCYEEMDEEEEESDVEESSQNCESIFGPRAEILFGEYMLERASDFDFNLLNEDDLLTGLASFRSIQPIYQQVITRHISTQLFTTLKQATLKAIESLCKNCEKNRLVAGRLNAIPWILQCSMRQEGERTPILQLAILALRALCLTCPENQERLLDITEACGHFIDRQRLFLSMGIELAMDKSGKQILVPLDKE